MNGMRYAGNVVRTSLQACLQRFYLFYDRRFDCVPVQAEPRYPSKLEFDSTHSHVFELVPPRSASRSRHRYGSFRCGSERSKTLFCNGGRHRVSAISSRFDNFIIANLNEAIPDVGDRPFDYVLVLDVIEHLVSPEDFLDKLRQLSAPWPNCRLVVTTGNIGFILTRLSLLLGRFEYGRRGILDLTHTRLFTFATFRRALQSAGFSIESTEGIGAAIIVHFRTVTDPTPLNEHSKSACEIRPDNVWISMHACRSAQSYSRVAFDTSPRSGFGEEGCSAARSEQLSRPR